MHFYGTRTTNHHAKYWKNRKIDWKKDYQSTYNHPHRYLLSSVLSMFDWYSLIEVGCGGGANIIHLLQFFKGKQFGGVDINPEAIESCKNVFKGGIWKVGPADDIMMSDKSLDVILTDMMLIYVGNRRIMKHLKEFRRIARNSIVLCEFIEKQWYKRIWLHWKTGYYFYNYPKLLKKLGFYDIYLLKLPPLAWPGGGLQEKYGYIIKAKCPKRYV